MAITSIEISGVGGIYHLALPLDPYLNIFCGPNGIGKTCILESVSSAFHIGSLSRIKRHYLCDTGSIKIEGSLDDISLIGVTNIKNFLPDISDNIQGNYRVAHWVLYLGTSRDISYQRLASISSDPTLDDSRNHAKTHALVRLNDVKNWFIHRYMYSKHAGALTAELMENFEHATLALGNLQDGFKFHNVDAKRSELMMSTPTGILPFEYLSSGFRSCIALIFGIIKEIEHRFPPEQAKAVSFAGVIMIDEIELHLHPDWQRRICSLLRACFPAAQFIITTHSPHVIQTACISSVIALRNTGSGRLEKASLSISKYGFRGWTIEEILTDVMGMEITTSDDLQEALKEFSHAEGHRDAKAVDVAFEKLDLMLHPNSALRQILKIRHADLLADHDKA